VIHGCTLLRQACRRDQKYGDPDGSAIFAAGAASSHHSAMQAIIADTARRIEFVCSRALALMPARSTRAWHPMRSFRGTGLHHSAAGYECVGRRVARGSCRRALTQCMLAHSRRILLDSALPVLKA